MSMCIVVFQLVNMFYVKSDIPKTRIRWTLIMLLRRMNQLTINKTNTLYTVCEQFTTSNNFLANTLKMYFSFIKLTKIRGVHDHITHIMDIVVQP
ncbi:hypothetical protein CR513_44315, partial [Mucuna pruriens]